MTKSVGKPELVVLHEAGEVWNDLRVALPEGLTAGDIEFVSPGLEPMAWVLSLLGSRSSFRRVGTLGALWADFSPDERVQLWIPGELSIPAGVVVQISFSAGP